jgi:uncharacterized MAPEG superfamily protein
MLVYFATPCQYLNYYIASMIVFTSEWWWMDENKHPCLKWDSNPRSQRPSDQGVRLKDRAATGTSNSFVYVCIFVCMNVCTHPDWILTVATVYTLYVHVYIYIYTSRNTRRCSGFKIKWKNSSDMFVVGFWIVGTQNLVVIGWGVKELISKIQTDTHTFAFIYKKIYISTVSVECEFRRNGTTAIR